MQTINPTELFELLKANADIQLIDVREPYEHAEFNIGGELIPLDQVTQQLERIDKDRPVVMYCRKGIRSHIAIQRLQNKLPFENLINLTGGIDEWKKRLNV